MRQINVVLGTPTAVGNSIDGLLLHRMFSRQISGVDSIPPECQSACQGIISDALVRQPTQNSSNMTQA